jgi:hypothetical protein
MRRERGSTTDKHFLRDSRETPRRGKARRPVGSSDRIGTRFSRRSTARGISAKNTAKVKKEGQTKLTNATSLSSLRKVNKAFY